MTITAIIPIYNAAGFIEKAVDSVRQFPEVKEILLIDDGSKDGSLKICRNLEHQFPEVKVLTHPHNENRGVSATRNIGMDYATQDFIAFLDADDYWLPNRFDAERELFKNPKVDGVFGAIGVEFVTEAGKKKYLEVINDTGLTTVYHPAEGKEVFYGLTQLKPDFGTFFSLIATTLRRSALEKTKLRLNENLRMHEDKDFIVKLSWHCHLKSGFIDRAVAIRTGHEENTFSSVQNFSRKFFSNQHLLYRSLYEWAKSIKEMPSEAPELFKLKMLSSKIAALTGLKKYTYFVISSILNPKLLKTRYRYYALRENL